MRVQPATSPVAVGIDDLLAGWDMAYVTSLKTVNDALKSQGFWPRAIKVKSINDPATIMDATVNSILLAASSDAMGGTIVLAIDLIDVTITGGAANLTTATFFANAQLEMLTEPSPHSNITRDPRLSPNPKSAPFMIRKLTGKSSVILQDPDDPDLDRLVQLSNVQPFLQTWLDTELMELAMTFAEADPGLETLTSGKFGWSLPGALAYAVAVPTIKNGVLPEESSCIFALLGVNDRDRLADLVPQIRSDCLPPGVDAAYILSAPLLLKNVIGPGILAALRAKGSPQLVVGGDGVSLYNSSTLDLPDLDLSSDVGTSEFVETGSQVQITDGNLEVRIDNDELHISVSNMQFTTASDAENVTLSFSFTTTISAGTDGNIQLEMPKSYAGSAEIMMTDKSYEYARWSRFAVSVVTALLACIPGGSAEVTLGKIAEEGTASIVTTAVSDATEATTNDVGIIAIQADKELAAEAAPAIKGFAAAFAKKAAMTVGIAVAQEILTDAPNLLRMYQEVRKAGNIENWKSTLDEITSRITSAAWFGNDPDGEVRCIGAQLENGLLLQLKLGKSS